MGSVLALFVIGLRFLTYKRLKKGLFYFVWIIVFLKFVVSIGVDPSKISAIGSDRYAIGFLNNDSAIIIDGNGTLITETGYDSIGTFNGLESDFAFCEKDGKYGYVDSSGNEVLEPIYDRVTNVENGRGFVTIGQDVYIFVWGQDLANQIINNLFGLSDFLIRNPKKIWL